MTWKHLLPLIGFVLPTVVIGFGFVIPRSCIAGVNELTIGFASTIVGACVTYVVGLRQALPRMCSVSAQESGNTDKHSGTGRP
jgi:ABC-type Fe3+ transport system permease subunit